MVCMWVYSKKQLYNTKQESTWCLEKSEFTAYFKLLSISEKVLQQNL